MKLIAKLLFLVLSNLAALWLAAYFVSGVEIPSDFIKLLIVAAIFTLINIFIKPVLRLILSPLIILTLGLAIIFINALMLYLLDYFSADITINGLSSLTYAALIVSAVNFIFNFAAKGTKS